jgi:hypothetical protein
MTQPTAYTPVTNFADDERNNSGGRSTVRTDKVDAEFASVAVSLNKAIANLGLIQRDDGKLKDALIESYNFSAAAKAFFLATKWNARGLWAGAKVYAVNDLVDVSGAAYVCATAHTSGVFATDYAAGKWQIFTSSSSAAALSFSPTSTIAATDVQSAIAETDTENRALSNPVLASLYGAF